MSVVELQVTAGAEDQLLEEVVHARHGHRHTPWCPGGAFVLYRPRHGVDVGETAVIGGNVWLTTSVPPHRYLHHTSQVRARSVAGTLEPLDHSI
jgi:hypothetical protein